MNDNLFSPQTVDEQIEQASQSNDMTNTDIVERLHQMYLHQAQDTERDLDQVWNQLVSSSIQTTSQEEHTGHHPLQRIRPAEIPEKGVLYTFPRTRKPLLQQFGVIALVACVLLLIGSTLVVFHAVSQHKTTVGHQTISSPTAISTHTPVSSQTDVGSTVYTYYDKSFGTAASDYGINSVSWSPDGKRIASTSTTVQVWDATTGEHLLVHKPIQDANLFDSRWSPDGKRIATSVPLAEMWDATTGKTLVSCPYPDQQTAISTGRFIADTSMPSVSQGYQKSTVQLLSLQTLLNPASMGPIPPMLSWSPDGRYIATAYQSPVSPMIVVWNAATCKLITTFQGQSDISFDVEWSPDGKYIASASADKTVQVWDVATHQPVYTYRDPAGQAIYRIAWSPDGKRIASVDASGSTVDVWDALTGEHQVIYSNHSQAVTSIAWSPDGKRIASGGSYTQKDGTVTGEVQLWNPNTGQHLFTYHGNPETVLAVAWSPNGMFIASADGFAPATYNGGQSTVKVWRAV